LPNTVGTVGFDANAQSAWDAAQGYGHSGIVIAILDKITWKVSGLPVL